MTNWGTFLDYDYVKERKEYLRLNECGLKGMSSELKESETTSKMANRSRISEAVCPPLWAEMLLLL